jgi:hypothetical protein
MKNSAAIFLIFFLAFFAAAQQIKIDSNKHELTLLFFAAEQQAKIDSLKHELTLAKEDTNKVYLLGGLSRLYYGASADTGVAYAQQALELAKK